MFKKLTTYHHFLVFLVMLTVLKITNVFITEGAENGFHYAKLGVGLVVISSILYLVFRTIFDKEKTYINAMISTFLIILMLSHADPEPITGVMVILFLYVSKFLVKYKGENIFNPIVFTIGFVTILALVIPSLGVPPLDFTGLNIRFPISGYEVPLTIIPITLAFLFNVPRIKRQPLAISFLAVSLLLGFITGGLENDPLSFVLIFLFIATAVIIEPKTSPLQVKEQIIFGVLIAVLITLLTLLNIPNPIIIGLFIGNIGLFFYKKTK